MDAINRQITALYCGRSEILLPENKPSAINKHPVSGPVAVKTLGLEGDQQVDLKHHGGPDKALHQYAEPDYLKLANTFPEVAEQLKSGALGENFTVPDLDCTQICIGDIFQLGSARIQVSEPRQPCWKINSKLGIKGVTKYIDDNAIIGWYFRVLETGEAEAGSDFKLLERCNSEWTIEHFWRNFRDRELSLATATQMSELNGLSTFWKERMQKKAKAIRANQ